MKTQCYFRHLLLAIAAGGACLSGLRATATTSTTLPKADNQGYLQQDPNRIKKLGPHLFQVGAIQVDSEARKLSFPAKVIVREGLIEVMICTPNGKRHESILCSEARPMDLHLALLLLRLKPGINPFWRPLDDPSAQAEMKKIPPGAMLDVSISWKDASGKRKEMPAEQLVIDNRTSKTLPATHWVFVGSYVDRYGAYLADQSGSIMTNYHDVYAVIDLPLDAGQSDDYSFANAKLIPPSGSAVEVEIKPANQLTREDRK